MTAYQNMKTAEAAWNADESNMDLLDALAVAERAYFDLDALRAAEWDKVPEGYSKDCAEQNANDTADEGGFDHADTASWFECAISTYDMMEG